MGEEDTGRSKALESLRQRARYAHALTRIERQEYLLCRRNSDLVSNLAARLEKDAKDLVGKIKKLQKRNEDEKEKYEVSEVAGFS